MSQRATASEGLPGEPIMWTLIGGEVLVFGAAPTGFLDARDAIAAAAAPALAGLAAAAWRRGFDAALAPPSLTLFAAWLIPSP